MSTHPFDSSSFAHVKLKDVPQHLQGDAMAYNEKQDAAYRDYGKIASSVDNAMSDMYREAKAFDKAGWEGDENGWYSPNGISDMKWAMDYGLPLPCDPEWELYVTQLRTESGWRLDDSGWYAPTGQHESDWTGKLPEYNF